MTEFAPTEGRFHGHLLPDWICSGGRSADWICSDGGVRVGYHVTTDWFCSVTRWFSAAESAKLTDFAPTKGLFATSWRPAFGQWLTLFRFSGRFSGLWLNLLRRKDRFKGKIQSNLPLLADWFHRPNWLNMLRRAHCETFYILFGYFLIIENRPRWLLASSLFALLYDFLSYKIWILNDLYYLII